METENKLARSYVDYLLGRVICCDTAEQLRCYKTAITAEGMLYQGYVARALRKGWMEDAFIGRRAVQLRIEHLEKELACLQEELRHWQPLQKQLTGLKEPLLPKDSSESMWRKAGGLPARPDDHQGNRRSQKSAFSAEFVLVG